MRIVISLLLVLSLFFSSCDNKKANDKSSGNDIHLSKKEFYEHKMKEKNFQLKMLGPCEDVPGDTPGETQDVFIDSKNITGTNAVVEFRFVDDCCMEFSGDYNIKNDTLTFQYEQINDVKCDCYCLYKYRLTINKTKAPFHAIEIKQK